VQIGILEPSDFSKVAIEKLESVGQVTKFSGEDLDIFLMEKDVLFIRLSYVISKDFMNMAKKLKYLCTPTTGLNHIDLQECKARAVEVISLKGEIDFLSTIRATPEHTFGLTLSLLRNYKYCFLSVNNKSWDRDKYKGFELYKNTIGIVGFGRVGKLLSKYFQAFGSSVFFFDTDASIREENNSVRVSTLTKLIDMSNIVILSASYSESNYEFFNTKHIDSLKGKYFINTARGELVDESYLIDKISVGHFKGVALDVIQNEQTQGNKEKLILASRNENCIVTPHISGATLSSMYKTEEFIASKICHLIT
jgi:D-3-phosphoglycerate dehydrogenase